MALFKAYLSGPVEAVIKARVALHTEAANSKERYLTLFSAIVSYLLKRFGVDDNITIAASNIRNFKEAA